MPPANTASVTMISMPWRAPKPCRQPSCASLAVAHGYCGQHQPPTAWDRYSPQLPPDWPQLQAAILERDAHTCQQCGDTAVQVDHITPRSDGGSNTPNNLRALCRRCHAVITARHAAARSAAERRR